MPFDAAPDLSKACWRCLNWGGLVAGAHGKCTRLDSPLQADPATGCVHWTPGAGDGHPVDWMPPCYALRPKVVIWGRQVPLSERPTLPTHDGRPGNPTDALKWDQEQERSAWRATDALMARMARL